MTAPRILFPKGAKNSVSAAYDGSIVVDLYDLMYLDTDDAKPASSKADAGNELANQQAFGPLFLGVAGEAKLSGDPAGEVRVLLDVQAEFDCAADTFELGDLVTVDEAANGTQLEDRKLVKTADTTAAIGHVIRREPATTSRVQVRLLSNVLPNSNAAIP